MSRKWLENDSFIDLLLSKMDTILINQDKLWQFVSTLPNITQEIKDVTETIKADTEALRGIYHAK